jgi:hypothetical protein
MFRCAVRADRVRHGPVRSAATADCRCQPTRWTAKCRLLAITFLALPLGCASLLAGAEEPSCKYLTVAAATDDPEHLKRSYAGQAPKSALFLI